MKTILVAEDDHTSRMILVKILQMMGYEVLESENGQIAYDILMRIPDIDLLITDIVMPEMDGRALVYLLRGQEVHTQLPVIFVSGVLKEDEILNNGDPGPTRYLEKPVNRKQLQAYVDELLNISV